MAGFTLHLTSIYQPVFKPTTPEPALGDGDVAGIETPYITPLDIFDLLSFSLFGLVDPDNLPSLYRSPIWVVSLVKIVFGTYMMVTLIVLINLLIAMMSDTYQRIQQQSETEWRFGRAKLIRNMNKTSASPSPLNLFTKLFQYIRLAYRHKGKLCSAQAQAYIHEEDDMDAMSDIRSMDILANSSSVWLQTIRRRRSAKFTPDGAAGMVRSHHGPQRLEDALDWKAVTKRYYKMQGVDESTDDEEERNGFLNHSNNNHIDVHSNETQG